MDSGNINSASASANSSAYILQNTKLNAKEFNKEVSIFQANVLRALKENGGEDHIDSSDGIDEKEASILKKWANCIDKIVGNISNEVRSKCQNAMVDLQRLHASLMCTIEEKGNIGVKENFQEGMENKNIKYVGKRASEYINEQDTATVNEPTDTDAQKIPTESEWLSSVTDEIKNEYLRIIYPEKYQGHGGTLNVIQKKPNAKVGGLTGILKLHRNELNNGQIKFLEKEIAGWKEVAKMQQDEQEKTNKTAHLRQTTYGSHFYDNPENGKKLIKSMHEVNITEGLTPTNARKIIGLD